MTYSDTAKYIPTPEQIRIAAAEIRKGWGPFEYARRSAYPLTEPEWLPPIVDSRAIVKNSNYMDSDYGD